MALNKAALTRQKIIETVAPLFNKRGYQGTALSEITAATKLTKGAIYGNFGGKEELAEACFDHNVKFLQRGLFMAWAANTTSIGKLEALLNFYLQNYPTVAQNGGCPLMNAAVEADDLFPMFKEKTKTILINWQNEIAAVISEGQKNREINHEINALIFANSFIAMIEGGILIAKTRDDPEQFYAIIHHLKILVNSQLKI